MSGSSPLYLSSPTPTTTINLVSFQFVFFLSLQCSLFFLIIVFDPWHLYLQPNRSMCFLEAKRKTPKERTFYSLAFETNDCDHLTKASVELSRRQARACGVARWQHTQKKEFGRRCRHAMAWRNVLWACIQTEPPHGCHSLTPTWGWGPNDGTHPNHRVSLSPSPCCLLPCPHGHGTLGFLPLLAWQRFLELLQGTPSAVLQMSQMEGSCSFTTIVDGFTYCSWTSRVPLKYKGFFYCR